MAKENCLDRILQAKLVGVTFILDYFSFQFDQYFLSALAAPTLVDGGIATKLGEHGYRDALCSQIGKTVEAVSETEERLEVVLSDGAKLILPLDADYPPGPEMATFSGMGNASNVFNAWWRKGVRPDERPI